MKELAGNWMNTAKIIDGKALADSLAVQLKQAIMNNAEKPVLAVILVGDNEASHIYVRNKQKAAKEAGIESRVFDLPKDTSSDEVKNLIKTLNEDKEVNGILLQLPLPKHIDSLEMLKIIDPKKDVDGFSPYNVGLLSINSPDAVIAATPKGILYMLKSVCDDLSGKDVVIIGRSNIVGRPLALLMLNNDCTVTVAHSKTKNLSSITQRADIVVAACGCPKMLEKEWVKEGAVVIDVGINKLNGKLCGDVDFDEVIKKAGYISPVPKGVGPMTIIMLLQNTYEAFLKQNMIV